ncbi:MAG TPA: hypothetical protein VG675_07840 [Bryobacteraceae bacterium]|nr:hypothetical protein [Bryobacteraceae bacterium]
MPGKIRAEPDAVRAAVARITASSGFAKSERLNSFLRLIVEETLAGRGDQIKEYLIGTQVYGRRHDYDPRIDATVRVEAAKLRKRLELYYGNDGRDEAVVIRIPKGSYRPEFELRTVKGNFRSRAAPALRPLLVVSAAVFLLIPIAAAVWVIRLHSRAPRLVSQRLISTFAGSHHNANFSPDGTMIAFVEGGDGADERSASQIWVKDLSEGRPVQITSGGTDAMRPMWSARGDEIIFERRGQGIWSVPPLGGDEHRIIEEGSDASLSADGSQLLFVRRRAIWIAAQDGSTPRRVDGVPDRFLTMQCPPAFSPDGRFIAFFNAEVGPLGDIWVIPTAGGRPRRVTSDQAEMRGLAWSRDGRWILFSSARAGSFTLWRVPFTGGTPEPVTTGAGEDVEPALSADGRRLIYTNSRTSWSLMLLDPASRTQKELFTQREMVGFPAFSPDGQRIAFFQSTNGDPHLFVLRADGGARQQISRGKVQEILPAWSGDGSSLYFYQVKPELSFRKLELSRGTTAKVAGWAYGKQNWAQIDSSGHNAVYTVVGPKGPRFTLVRDLTTGHEQALPVALTRSEWSSDGRFILGESGSREIEGNSRITICEKAGNRCREVTYGLAPRWSADGHRIYFLRRTQRVGWFDLWAAARDGAEEQRITTLGQFRSDSIHFDVSREGRIVWAPVHPGRQELWLAELE